MIKNYNTRTQRNLSQVDKFKGFYADSTSALQSTSSKTVSTRVGGCVFTNSRVGSAAQININRGASLKSGYMLGGTAELAHPQRYRLGLGTAASVRPETAGVKQSMNNMFLDKYRTSESQSLAQNIINKTFKKSKK